MYQGVCGVYDKEEECGGEGEQKGYGQAIDAKVSVVDKVDIECDVDRAYKNVHIGGCVHDLYID
jgi:hypothetical protein